MTFVVETFHRGNCRTQGGFKGGNATRKFTHPIEDIARTNAERWAKDQVESKGCEYAKVSPA